MPVHALSSRGINKFHLEGDCHLESNIEAIKVYQCLSKLSRSSASYETSKPHEYNLNNIRDMKNSEATKQSMLPDTSTCVVDHDEELSKDSVTDYVNPYQSPAIEQGLRQYMLPGTENLPRLIPYKKTSSLFQKDKVIRKCMVHYLNKDVPRSSELRKCLSLAFGKYYISIPRPQLRHIKTIFESWRF